MTHARRFTRPLLTRLTDHGSAFIELLADRAEDHPDLAKHMLVALADLEQAFPDLPADDAPRPVIAEQ